MLLKALSGDREAEVRARAATELGRRNRRWARAGLRARLSDASGLVRKEALAALRGSPDLGLVILDLMMPRMSGVDVLAEMRRDPALAAMPVVVISGNYIEQAVLAMGAADYLVKPLDVDVLMRVVSRFVPVAKT